MGQVKIIFIKNFATKKKDEIWQCDSMLARDLINRKVAEKIDEEEKPKRGRPKAE